MGLPLIPVHTTGTYRWFIVLLTALASGLLTGIIFGFVPLQNVMILEGIYADECAPGEAVPCDAQYLKFNLIFTYASVVFNIVALPTGFILDKTGPRATMALASLICVGANLLFAFSTNDFPAWLAAYCILGVGGVMVYISQFYLAAYFPGHEGFVFSVINGFMNASNAFYMVCEPMYNAGLSLKTQFMIFAAIPLVIGILAVLFYPPLEGQEAPSENAQRRGSTVSSKSWSDPVDEFESGGAPVSSWQQGYNIRDKPLIRKMLSFDSFLFCIFLGFTSLFQVFYMGTLDQQLGKMGGGDPATYVNMFFLVLPFVSLVGVPISGWVLDKLGTVVSLFITRILFLILNVCLLFPSLPVQAVGFVAYTLANLMLWASVPAAMERIFGQDDFGSMYGLIMTFTGLVNLLQNVLLQLTYNQFGGNFDYCNYLFLGLGVILFILPIWLMIKDRQWARSNGGDGIHQSSADLVHANEKDDL